MEKLRAIVKLQAIKIKEKQKWYSSIPVTVSANIFDWVSKSNDVLMLILIFVDTGGGPVRTNSSIAQRIIEHATYKMQFIALRADTGEKPGPTILKFIWVSHRGPFVTCLVLVAR